MVKIKVDDNTVRGESIDIERMEIVVDDSKPTKVEIYLLDETGQRVEGGTFSRDDFMSTIRKFYDENY
jgi:metal-dependent HD superfamily phosphatase/phosphodiesterase